MTRPGEIQDWKSGPRHINHFGTGVGIPVLLPRYRLPASFQTMVREQHANQGLKGCLSKGKVNCNVNVNVKDQRTLT